MTTRKTKRSGDGPRHAAMRAAARGDAPRRIAPPLTVWIAFCERCGTLGPAAGPEEIAAGIELAALLHFCHGAQARPLPRTHVLHLKNMLVVLPPARALGPVKAKRRAKKRGRRS
jgi:hypothetical protein